LTVKGAAEFIKALKFSNLSRDTILASKNCLLDFIGAALGGANTRAGAAALRFVRHLPGPGRASIWSTGDKVPVLNAAFVNSTMGSALDIDDGHRMAVGHPGGAVIPAAVALGEDIECSGRELLEAIICGYEVAIRAGNIYYSRQLEVSGSGRWASIGAAAAAAKLLDLETEQIRQALAISATFSPVALFGNDLANGFMPMTKFSNNWASCVGICAALLAREGFTGVSSFIDFSESALPSFGQSFEIERVYFKPYPCCRWTHSAIEGILQLMKEHKDLQKENIKKITVKTFLNASYLLESRPKTMESAQYSIPFLIGAAIIDGRVTPEQIAEDRLSDAAILSIADKVEVIHCPDLDSHFPRMIPTEVEVETVSGSRYRIRVTVPKGDPQNPLSVEELRKKFKDLAKRSINLETAEKIIEKIEILEQLNNLHELTSLFRKL